MPEEMLAVTPPEPSERPIAVARGRTMLLAGALFAIAATIVLLGLEAPARVDTAWRRALIGFPVEPPSLWFASLMVALTIGAFAAYRFARDVHLAGHVELYESKLVFVRFDVSLPLAWESIVAFDDGSSDFVALVTERDAEASWSIPTLDDAARAVVLEMLARRGIPRRER